MANKKCVKSAAEKESDRLRSQRYPDEHSKDPEYRVKRAKKAWWCPYACGDPLAVGSGVLLDITMRETQLIQSKFNQVWSHDSQMIVWICSLQTNGPNPYPYNIVKPCMTLSMHNFSSIM